MTGNPPEPVWNREPDSIIGKYILKHRKPIPCPNLTKWAKRMKRRYAHRVRSTYIGDCWVSTVFLWVDHNWIGDGEPVLFETMIFAKDKDSELHSYCERTTSWRKALKQHWQIVEKVKHG